MNVKNILFYKTTSGNCPVEEHLDSLSDEQTAKIAWVLKLIREPDQVNTRFFKKLVNTKDIWEIKINIQGNTFRLLGYFDDPETFILTNSFQKKSRKTPVKEIRLAENRRKDFYSRR